MRSIRDSAWQSAVFKDNSSGGWRVSDTIKHRKTGHPLFWQRLHKVNVGWTKNQYSGVWVSYWTSARLDLEICAEGWPEEDAALALRIRSTLRDSVKASTEFLREHPGNSDSQRRMSCYFDGDKAFLTGSVEEGGKQITDLVSSLVEAVDQP